MCNFFQGLCKKYFLALNYIFRCNKVVFRYKMNCSSVVCQASEDVPHDSDVISNNRFNSTGCRQQMLDRKVVPEPSNYVDPGTSPIWINYIVLYIEFSSLKMKCVFQF